MSDNRHKGRDAGIDRTAMLRTAFMSPEVQVHLQHVASGSRSKEHIFVFTCAESETTWNWVLIISEYELNTGHFWC